MLGLRAAITFDPTRRPPTWDEVQIALIEYTLARYGGNKVRTAKALGIAIRTLRNKINEFGMTHWKKPRPKCFVAAALRPRHEPKAL